MVHLEEIVDDDVDKVQLQQIDLNPPVLAEPPVDRLSDLPTDLTWSVLRELSISELVSTSQLCRSWRRLWTTIPFLTFNGCSANLVVHGLVRHEGLIHRLHINFSREMILTNNIMTTLMLRIFRKDVRQLILQLPSRSIHQLTELFFCFRSLVLLRIGYAIIIKHPFYFEGFIRLAILDLSLVRLPEETINIILSRSPIQRLRIHKCQGFSRLTFNTSKLELLIFVGPQSLAFDYTPKLNEVYMRILYPRGYRIEEPVILERIFEGLLSCQTLTANGRFLQVVPMPIIHERLLLTSLRRLSVAVNFLNANDVAILQCLAQSSPHLETLMIRSICFIYMSLRVSFGVGQNELSFPRLHRCEFVGFRGFTAEVRFVKRILETAPQLKFLHISWSGSDNSAQYAQIYELYRASETMEISMEDEEVPDIDPLLDLKE